MSKKWSGIRKDSADFRAHLFPNKRFCFATLFQQGNHKAVMMHYCWKSLFTCVLFLIGLAWEVPYLQAQETIVTGIVQDGNEGVPLSFATVLFKGTDVGTTTDVDGTFDIRTTRPVDSLKVSFLGYDSKTFPIAAGETQSVEVTLYESSAELEEVVVRAKRKRYRRKGNPAVALIKSVMDNRRENNLKLQDYYQYDQYEKIELDVTNITEKLMERRLLNDIHFVFDYMDTTSAGVPYIPFFLQENKSTFYYRKDPQAFKEVRKGLKLTNLDNYTTEESISRLTDRLYQEVNLYDERIFLFGKQFVSPLAPIGIQYYRYYITDTLTYNGAKSIQLSFVPNNKYNLGFSGDLYIAHDSSFAVLGVRLEVLEEANLNFVNELQIHQDFRQVDSLWVLSRNDIYLELEIAKRFVGIIGRKTTIYDNYRFNEPASPHVYERAGDLYREEHAETRDSAFWEEQRPVPLTDQEADIYFMIDTLQEVPSVKTALEIIKLITAGYYTQGPVDIGPVASFLSFNDVEGWRLKLGGQTNANFSNHLVLGGYLAYGLEDKVMKFSSRIQYNFDETFSNFPTEYIRFTYQRDNIFPGEVSLYNSFDNFFASFRTIATDRMLSYEEIRGEYFRELPNNLFMTYSAARNSQRAVGDWTFEANDPDADALEPYGPVETAELGVDITFAPNAEFFEGLYTRYVYPSRFPSFWLNARMGIKDFLGGDHNFQRVNLGIQKRFFLTSFGQLDVQLEAGQVFGDNLPYTLLHFPDVNTSITYRPRGYNNLNFLEFVSDQYAVVYLNHGFNGVLVNQIPLLRRLDLREYLSFKVYYGSLSPENDPRLTPGIPIFSQNDDGSSYTYVIDGRPYLEAGFGIGNILKFFRLDYVRRLNYLDHPNLPEVFGIKGSSLRLNIVFDI